MSEATIPDLIRELYEVMIDEYRGFMSQSDFDRITAGPIRCATRMVLRYLSSHRATRQNIMVLGAAASLASAAYGLDEEMNEAIWPHNWLDFMGYEYPTDADIEKFIFYQGELFKSENFDVCRTEKDEMRGGARRSQKSSKRLSPRKKRIPKRR